MSDPNRKRFVALAARLREGGYVDAARNLPRMADKFGLPLKRVGRPVIWVSECPATPISDAMLIATIGTEEGDTVATEHELLIPRRNSLPDDLLAGVKTMRTMRFPDRLWEEMGRCAGKSRSAAIVEACAYWLERERTT